MKRTLLSKGTSKLNKSSKGLKRSGSISRGKKALKSRPKDPIKVQEKKNLRDEMLELFNTIWEERGPFSELSGLFLGSENLTVFHHHIFPKKSYPTLCLEPLNIIVLSFDEHTRVEGDPYFYHEINRRREEIKKKFNIV